MKVLVVIDMQNDFVNGSLGSSRAEEIVDAVVQKINEYDGEVVFTLDTHDELYLSTQEGKYLPVPHCVRDTDGWKLNSEVEKAIYNKNPYAKSFMKNVFASHELVEYLGEFVGLDEVELIGLCTDICVVSNAILIKSLLPEVTVRVDSNCCAGTTEENHNGAILTMRSCQMEVE